MIQVLFFSLLHLLTTSYDLLNFFSMMFSMPLLASALRMLKDLMGSLCLHLAYWNSFSSLSHHLYFLLAGSLHTVAVFPIWSTILIHQITILLLYFLSCLKFFIYFTSIKDSEISIMSQSSIWAPVWCLSRSFDSLLNLGHTLLEMLVKLLLLSWTYQRLLIEFVT